MGKGALARYEQFLLFPQCFQKACFPGASLCENGLTLNSLPRLNQQIFRFFLLFRRTFCHFHQIQNCRLQTLSVWKSLKLFVRERVQAPEDTDTDFVHVCLSDVMLKRDKQIILIIRLSQTRNFILFQNKKVCRRQFQI